ncbi:MAG: hypothetical protein KatS3mg062_0901 [Tepidiforma sp.]|nr:MAG: hypothetical protein KatS3mg062_0901 [Tepidiforma sp.]
MNAVCGQLFTANAGGGAPQQAPWVPLEAGPNAEDGVPVRVFGGAQARAAGEIREAEADAVALGVLQARAENWAGAEEGTRFADVAILLPRRTGLAAIERALADRDIPYRVESRSLLYASEEARELANVLTAVDDPTDRIALVAALRSPLFACTDAELHEHVLAGGRWTYEEEAPGESPERVRRALQRLRRWHEERWMLTPAGLIERIAAEGNLLLTTLGDRRPREAWRRYRLLAETARTLTVRGSVATLRQFIAWLEQQRAEGVRVNEAIAPEPDDDAVRILTIHAAKGLEFPVVFAVGLGGDGDRGDGVRVLWPREGRADLPEVRCGSGEKAFETRSYAEREKQEGEQAEAEQVRLFYVAATRAKRALAVSLFRKAKKQGSDDSIAGRVEAALSAAPEDAWERWEPSGAGGDAEGARQSATGEGGAAHVPSRTQWEAERQRVIERYAKDAVVAGTAVARGAGPAEEIIETEEEPATPGEPWRKGRAGTSLGRAVHAVLQSIDLATGEGVEAAAQAQAEAEGIADRAGEVERLARAALESAAVRDAAGRRYWREVYVGADIGGVLVEGFIDLLYEVDGGLVIVDYKTDSLRSAAEVEAAMAHYRLQGAAYALAAAKATGKPVERVVFVFTEPRMEREVTDLEAAMAEARERAKVLAGAGGGSAGG